MRSQIDVGETRPVAEAPRLVANQLLDGLKSERDPFVDPGGDLSVRPAGPPQLVEWANIIERVDIAPNDRRYTSHLGTFNRSSRAQMEARELVSFQIFEYGRRLSQHRTVAQLQYRNPRLGINSLERRKEMFAAVAYQVYGDAA